MGDAAARADLQLVFIHGSGGCSAVWHHQLRAFPGALAVDLPGHPKGELLGSAEAYAEWLHSMLAARGTERVVLIGHSLGGGIALAFALAYPQEVAGLVLVGSGGRLRVAPATLELMARAIENPRLIDPMHRNAWAKAEPELARSLIAAAKALGPAVFLGDFQVCDRFDVMPRLGEIATPILALCGDEDVMTPPKYAHYLVDKAPRARAEIIPGGTHMVFAEQPEAVNRAIADFVAELA